MVPVLIAARLWWANRTIINFAAVSYKPVFFLVLESGAVYTCTLTALLILYKAGSWFQYVLLDSVRRVLCVPCGGMLTLTQRADLRHRRKPLLISLLGCLQHAPPRASCSR